MSAQSWATTAFRRVKVSLVIGMSNQPARVEETGGWSKIATATARKAHHWEKTRGGSWKMVFDGKHTKTGVNQHARLLVTADIAEAARGGNCGEHAAVAYAWLFKHAMNKGVGWVSRVSVKKPGDHAFVVLNRDRSKKGVAGFNRNTLVIDAWGGFVCTGKDLVDVTGNAIMRAAGVDREDVARVQDYIQYYDCYTRCEFNTETGTIRSR